MSDFPNQLCSLSVDSRRITSHDQLEEYLAWKRGEDVTLTILTNVLSVKEKENLPEVRALLKVTSSVDGESTHYVTATLRRAFQAIDDYLSEFPEAEEFTLSCTSRVIKMAIEGLYERHLLVDCIDCIRYLNPKRASYYLLYNPVGTPINDLINISTMLSVRERRDMIMSRTSEYPLPEGGLTYDILAVVFEQTGAVNETAELFADYPSYLATYYITSGQDDKLDSLLLTANFDYDYVNIETQSLQTPLVKSLCRSITSQDITWDKLRLALAMLGIRDELFDNMNVASIMPYRAKWPPVNLYSGPYGKLIMNAIIRLSPNEITEARIRAVFQRMKDTALLRNSSSMTPGIRIVSGTVLYC
jgi:hypothetical protein